MQKILISRPWLRWSLYSFASILLSGILLWSLIGPGLRFMVTLQKPETPSPIELFSIEERFAHRGQQTIPLRIYRPHGKCDGLILLAHGVHCAGYNEARLVRFARELARRRFLVVTPDLQDLKTYDLNVHTIDDIEAATRFLLEDPSLMDISKQFKPCLYGISFSGGLCLSAAIRPSLRNRLGCVFSFGGHGDLAEVLRYLSTGRLPKGGFLPPHLYGQAVVLRSYADRFVPPDQAKALRNSLLLFLQERPKAFQDSIALLPPESKRLAECCARWDEQGLRSVLATQADAIQCDAALSPLRGTVPECPVFLLHGSVDNVIPPSETEALGDWASKGTHTEVLVTDLIRHVELENKTPIRFRLLETWRLGRFMTKLLRS